jgi:type III restriction enzyme
LTDLQDKTQLTRRSLARILTEGAQELFGQEELTGYLKNMLASEKWVYEEVVYDLGGERTFAEQLEKNTAVKVYAKLPGWFKVPTPLGTYNPDWAVLVETDGRERLYFVVETKPSLLTDALRFTEAAKIECGKAHFRALEVREGPVQYIVARTVDDLMARVDS